MNEQVKTTQALSEVDAQFKESWSAVHQFVGSIGARLVNEGKAESEEMAFVNKSLMALNDIASRRSQACGHILNKLKPNTLAAADNIQEIFNAYMFTNDMIAETNAVYKKVSEKFTHQSH